MLEQMAGIWRAKMVFLYRKSERSSLKKHFNLCMRVFVHSRSSRNMVEHLVAVEENTLQYL